MQETGNLESLAFSLFVSDLRNKNRLQKTENQV